MRSWLAFVVPFAFAAPAQTPARPQRGPVALVGGTIHCVDAPDVPGGTILFAGGRIRYVGPPRGAAFPPGTRVVEIRGRHVYPAFIGAFTRLGLTEVGSVRATQDFRELGDLNPNVRAWVAFHPASRHLPVTRANGVLLALSVPVGGLLSGQSALMMLDGWTWADMTLKAPVGLHVQWPRVRSRRRRPGRRTVSAPGPSRQERLARLRRAFRRARAYWQAKEGERAGAPRHPVDLRWEALGPVLRGEIPLFVHADEARAIEEALDFARTEGVRMVLVGGGEAPLLAAELKAQKVPVVVAGVHRLPWRRDLPYDAPFTLPRRLHAAGVPFCIATAGDAANERNLPYHAATAVAYGLPREAALRAITLSAAEILGVADRVGSLAVGKDATLIVTDGDPLQIPTHVVWAYLQGREVDLDTHHKRLYRRYREKYRRLGLGGGR